MSNTFRPNSCKIVGPRDEMFIDQIHPTSVAIAEEVKDTMVFFLPGGVHEDLIEAFGSGEGGRGDDYKLVVSWLSTTLNL